MIRAGQLDRVVTIQERVVTENSVGEDTYDWVDLATGVRAQVIQQSGREIFRAGSIQTAVDTLFVMRYRPDVSVSNRIVYNGKAYNLYSVRELGRRRGLEISANRPTPV